MSRVNGQAEVDRGRMGGSLWGDQVWSMQQKCGCQEGIVRA